MDTFEIVAWIGLVAAAWLAVRRFWPEAHIVHEYERGLQFKHGRLHAELGPGRYWLNQRADSLQTLDMRRRQLIVSGQEVLTSDRVPIKVSLILEFSVTHATRAATIVESYVDSVYTLAQLALRAEISVRDLDTALNDRGELGTALLARVVEPAQAFGLEVHALHIRDFMMAGGLRSAYADVIQARQEGLSALERARGEAAAARSLANTAQLIDRNPGILQLRLLQAIEHGSGNRIVVSTDLGRSRTQAAEIEAEADD